MTSVLRSAVAAALASTMLVGHAAAEDHRIALSAPWPDASELAPGDRILLEPGLHDARSIRDWPGTAAMPIVITSADDEIPAGLAGIDGPALVARGCGGLEIRRLLVIGDGLDLEGRGADGDSGIHVENVQFLPATRGADAMGPVIGVRVARTGRAELVGIGMQRWQQAGLSIDTVGEVDIRQPGLVGGPRSPIGIRLRDCGRATITGGGIVAASEAGVSVETSGPTTSRVVIDRVVWQQTATPLRITASMAAAGTTDVTLTRGTIVAPTTSVVEIAAAAPTPEPAPTAPGGIRLQLDRCLTAWSAGGLRRLFTVDDADGGIPVTLEIGDNLWWSPELPLALDLLGGFPAGTGGQRTDVDPRLVPRTWIPSADAAKRYGHAAAALPGE